MERPQRRVVNLMLSGLRPVAPAPGRRSLQVGRPIECDWEAILGSLGWLHLDRRIGMTVHFLGSLTMVSAVVAAGWCARPIGGDRVSMMHERV